MQLESNEHWEKINSFQLRHRIFRDNFVEVKEGILVWYETSNTDITIPVSAFFNIPYNRMVNAIEKGQPNGIPQLDATGKVPLSQLNFDSLVKLADKGQPSGIPELDASGKVPLSQLNFDSLVKLADKGQPNGIPQLDATGKVPLSQLNIDLSTTLKITDKGIINGVASLDATGRIPTSQLPMSGATIDIEGTIGTYSEFLSIFELGLL